MELEVVRSFLRHMGRIEGACALIRKLDSVKPDLDEPIGDGEARRRACRPHHDRLRAIVRSSEPWLEVWLAACEHTLDNVKGMRPKRPKCVRDGVGFTCGAQSVTVDLLRCPILCTSCIKGAREMLLRIAVGQIYGVAATYDDSDAEAER